MILIHFVEHCQSGRHTVNIENVNINLVYFPEFVDIAIFRRIQLLLISPKNDMSSTTAY